VAAVLCILAFFSLGRISARQATLVDCGRNNATNC
jgi:hypothetical protein